jgi:hypothetical protein
VRRLDEGIGKIAQQALVVGKLELRRRLADAVDRFRADPAVHVVVASESSRAAKVAAGASAKRSAQQRDRKYRQWPIADAISFWPAWHSALPV